MTTIDTWHCLFALADLRDQLANDSTSRSGWGLDLAVL
jgi:hypothetical protein